MSRVLSNLGKKKAPPCRLPMLVLLASPRVGERCREATERGRCLEITSTTGRRYGGLSCSLNVFGGICGTRGRRELRPCAAGADLAMPQFPQRSENTRIRVSPKCFPGTASRSGGVRRVTVRRMPDEGEARPSGRDRKSEGRLLPHHPPVCALEGASPAGGSTTRRRGASRCARQSLPRARGRWREAPDEVPGPVVEAGVPDGPFARLRDISRTAHTDIGLLET